MDSLDSDTFYIINLFQQGSYRAAISAYTALDQTSPTLSLYAARSHLALTPPSPSSALALLNSLPDSFNKRAIVAFAHFLESTDKQGQSEAIEELEEVLVELGDGGLLEGSEEGRMVRGVVGSCYYLEEGGERREEGIEVLREAVELGGDSECLAILVHIYLSLSLSTLSATLLTSPTVQSFTSDSLLSQLLTAQTNLATGPTSKYQESFYVYEEVKGMQGGRCESVMSGVGISLAMLGKMSEAGKAIEEGLEMNTSHSTSLANSAALAIHLGKSPAVAAAALERLRAVDPNHSMLLDIEEKSNLFDSAASRFGIAA